MKLSAENLMDFRKNNQKCYSMSNGIGGYTSGSVIGSFNRKHYGYLIASLKAPVNRMLILGKINEYVEEQSLENQEYEDGTIQNLEYLKEFTYCEYPTFTYEAKKVKISKSIAPIYGKNAVAISYILEPSEDTTIFLEPFFNYRDHGDASLVEDLRFDERKEARKLILIPFKDKTREIHFSFSEGELVANKDCYTSGIYARYDQETGDDRLDHYYKPYRLKIEAKKHERKEVSILCSLGAIEEKEASLYIKEYEDRIQSLKRLSKIKDELALDLVQASDAFITTRESTGLKTILAGLPWFTDWGRDTMIAFTGLTLVTKRFDEAREILKSFSLYERNGLIPNCFPDDGGEPMYNTVDASLWYFYACYKYIEYTKDKAFIMDEIYPTLKRIIEAYSTHTDNNIHMDTDGLISCGSLDTQITWMDVKTNGIAVTPRYGKPVEINALWYNALCIMDELKESSDSFDYKALANRVKKSFNEKFYCKETGCLYDTIDPMDVKIRPNQCWVLSLPFKVLEECYVESTFDVITRDLYNIYGLRSLSNRDKDFKPKYEGKLLDRDFAYHMGTTWGFLIGGYLDAYHYVYRDKENVREQIRGLVKLFIPHIMDGCIYGIAEIFDGDIASRTRGCYTQAWSVGELLRAYYENVLQYEE